MDASNTCSLVTTTAFTNYNQIVQLTGTALVDFNINSNYVRGIFTPPVTAPVNDFTTFISTSNNFVPTGHPVLPSGCNSIVSGYLGYPKAVYSNDYYTRTSFRNLSTVAQNIINAGDLCTSSNIFNSNVYTGTNLATLSLTTLYQTLASSNLNKQEIAAINSNIYILQNKNMMFYAFFTYEYCYYNTMYNTLLGQYFGEYTSTSSAPFAALPNVGNLKNSAGVASTTQVTKLDGIAITLARVNSRLTDMRNLLLSIQNYYSDSLQNLQLILNSSNAFGSDADVESKVIALMSQSSNVMQAQSDATMRQGIVAYTSEKNRYSNILLGIYAFLNIAIISVIFNIKE